MAKQSGEIRHIKSQQTNNQPANDRPQQLLLWQTTGNTKEVASKQPAAGITAATTPFTCAGEQVPGNA